MNYYAAYVVLGLIGASVLGWVIYLFVKEKNVIFDDVIWDTKMCPSLTDGYTKLVQRDVKIGKSGRLIVTAEARDIDYKKAEREHIKLPITIKFVIPSELVESLSKGDSGKDKHEKIALPRHAKDIPAKLRETAFGQAYAQHIEGKNRTRAIEEIMTKDNQAQTLIASKLGNNALLLELTRVTSEFQKMQSDLIKETKKAPTTPYTSPTGHSSGGN